MGSLRLSIRPQHFGCLVCVICNSKSFHSFLFKLCIISRLFFSFLSGVELIFPSKMLRGGLVCVICNSKSFFLYTPRKLCLWWGILFSRCPCVRACVRVCVRPSVTFCFLNILKSHCWIFINSCKHVHICKINTLDKKVRVRGQF